MAEPCQNSYMNQPRPDKLFDIIIIGGGISGLGIALEASGWGFDVLLLEKNRFCSATSDNSLRIIHGGFRYLQSFDLRRVSDSIRAQAELFREYPSLIKPLPCVMPLAARGLKSRLPVSMANIFYRSFYRMLTGRSAGNTILSPRFIDREIPVLSSGAPHGALLWYDGLIQDNGALAAEIVARATAAGAILLEHHEVIEVGHHGGVLLNVHSRTAGESFRHRGRVVINASGPWLDNINTRISVTGHRDSHQWCRAFNLVINRCLEKKYAIGIESRKAGGEKRLFFVTPRGEHSAIGTGYLPLSGSPEEASLSEQEINQFLSDFNEALPGLSLSASDVERYELGVLPVSGMEDGEPQLQKHEAITDHRGYIEVTSTKYTTFMNQARAALLAASKYLRSHKT